MSCPTSTEFTRSLLDKIEELSEALEARDQIIGILHTELSYERNRQTTSYVYTRETDK
jgi:hypothetical protein